MSLTCARCGNFKRTQRGQFCSSCELKNKNDIKLIQDYLMKHPRASLADVALDTGITLKVLNVLVKEGQIELNHAE